MTSIVQSGNRALLVNMASADIRLIDASNPSNPHLLSTYSAMVGWDVALKGSMAVVVGQTGNSPYRPRLELIDFQSASAGQLIGGLTSGNESAAFQGVAVAGNQAFVAVKDGSSTSLAIVDIGNPGSPSLVGSVGLSSPYVRRVAVSQDGSYAYVAGQGVHIVDTRTPAAPQLIQTIKPTLANNQNAQGVAVQGTRLFFTAFGYLFVYDVSNPQTPIELANYNIPGFGWDLRVVGDLVFVADSNAGLTILRLLDVSKPTVTITAPTSNATFETNSSVLSIGGQASDDKGVSRVTWSNNRGGSGVASGGSSWMAENLILYPGENLITFTAYDSEGNAGIDQITVNSSQPEGASPVIVILGPNPNDQFTVNSPSVTLSGKVADNDSVINVSWNNDRGFSGTATLTGQDWTVPELPLIEGPNLITVTAIDGDGNSSTDAAVIFYRDIDTVAPTIAIEFPTLNAVYETESSIINLSGVASDNAGLASLKWKNNRGGNGSLSGSDPWSINDVLLESGLNVIEVTATDESGNTSTDTLAVMVVDPIPVLSISLSEGKAVLAWPTNAVGFSLESTAELRSESWSLESWVPSVVDGLYVITNELAGEKRFFRLKN